MRTSAWIRSVPPGAGPGRSLLDIPRATLTSACPECRASESGASLTWTSAGLVCRAVRMIVAGALNEGTETHLGARLGVSARHLRRLFDLHLGTTPDALARSVRLQLARRLLDDSDLTIIEVAFAAGFGSVRQFNRACQDAFQAAPREIRAGTAVEGTCADWVSLRIRTHGQYDWDSLLRSLARRSIPGMERVSPQAYRRTIVAEGGPGVIELAPMCGDLLVLRVYAVGVSDLVHLVERAGRMIEVDLPGAAFSPRRMRLGSAARGSWDSFEAGVRAIVACGRSDDATRELLVWLVEQLGAPVPELRRFGVSHIFPSPEAIATGDLSASGLSPASMHALRRFAARFAEAMQLSA